MLSVITNMLYPDNYESLKDKNLTKAELDHLVHHTPTNKQIFRNNIITAYIHICISVAGLFPMIYNHKMWRLRRSYLVEAVSLSLYSVSSRLSLSLFRLELSSCCLSNTTYVSCCGVYPAWSSNICFTSDSTPVNKHVYKLMWNNHNLSSKKLHIVLQASSLWYDYWMWIIDFDSLPSTMTCTFCKWESCFLTSSSSSCLLLYSLNLLFNLSWFLPRCCNRIIIIQGPLLQQTMLNVGKVYRTVHV